MEGFEPRASISWPSAAMPAANSAFTGKGTGIPGGGFSFLGFGCRSGLVALLASLSAEKEQMAARKIRRQSWHGFIAPRFNRQRHAEAMKNWPVAAEVRRRISAIRWHGIS